MAIGKRIKYYREQLGWTLEEMSSRCGVEIGTISAIENRDSDRSKYFGAIAKAFGLTIEQLSDIGTDWLSGPSVSGKDISQPAAALTPRQQALLGLFEGLTDSQKDALIRELQEKKQQNDELLTELLKRKAT
ncbi:helix-turn-helix domain-containing protein [Nitrosomonas sp.]|uniref:helix-turn-helix domain-containing protein n=1 Tax=Nitrosomonas sp. TaxID=42353 RepID=UPI0037C98146